MQFHCVYLVLGLFCFIPNRADAQFRPPEGQPNFIETQFLSVGGITYFRHVSQLSEWCERIGAYPATREGTNVTVAIQEEGQPPDSFCICDTLECGPAPREDITSVLGALPTGSYRLLILSTNTNMSFPGWPLFQVTAMGRYFEVGPGIEPTLAVSKLPNDDALQITVAGISNVNYVIERSADLVSWTAMRTNTGAPFVLHVNKSAQQQFYRVSISQLPLGE